MRDRRPPSAAVVGLHGEQNVHRRWDAQQADLALQRGPLGAAAFFPGNRFIRAVSGLAAGVRAQAGIRPLREELAAALGADHLAHVTIVRRCVYAA